MINIPAAVRDQVLEHVLQGFPNEACGLLAGHILDGTGDAAAQTFYPMTNADASPVTYRLDPKEHDRGKRIEGGNSGEQRQTAGMNDQSRFERSDRLSPESRSRPDRRSVHQVRDHRRFEAELLKIDRAAFEEDGQHIARLDHADDILDRAVGDRNPRVRDFA